MKLSSFSTLQLALGASIAVHASLLTVRLVDPEAFKQVMQDTALEVILVNANPQERPDKAQAIAQVAMAGGGEAARGRAKSPLPPALLNLDGEDKAQEQARQLREMQEQQNLLLHVKRLLSSLPPSEPQQQAQTPEQAQREQKQKQLVKLLAEIERRINLENARPKKRYISPATREAVYAIYYDHLRRTIEDRGTLNFPQANGQKLYGELTMVVTINHRGEVMATEVVQSSGNLALDQRARAIANSAGPFGKFSHAMRLQADEIAVVSRFNFTREDTLETKVSAN
ncbi:energy transducer TonB [Rhodoferax sp.]|uniref:energy transducer TonB n=1 Tax=Rhodoferax sp. TaxID=50421 RepID=UPI0025D9C452|nr:TonB family protein [Rhodoferax sp.]MCM2296441.1 TonB family protein [Rhodoferax sp.]MDD3935761.1 TonB family protein [Rhodoferax sp.]